MCCLIFLLLLKQLVNANLEKVSLPKCHSHEKKVDLMKLALVLNPYATSFAHIGDAPRHVPLPPGLSVFFVADGINAGDTIQAHTQYGKSHLLFTAQVMRVVPPLDGFATPDLEPSEQASVLRRASPATWFPTHYASPLNGMTKEQQRQAIASCFHQATLALFRHTSDLDNELHCLLTEQMRITNAHGNVENPGEFQPRYAFLKEVLS